MTEEEWLACTDPYDMVDFVWERLGDRKMRLFGCACARGVWNDLPDDALRQAIETCERFADGLAKSKELKKARELAHATYQGIGDIIADHSAIAVTALCEPKPWFPMGEGSSGGIAAVAAEAWFNEDTPWHKTYAQAKHAHCQVLHDLIDNPFHPAALDPAWRTSTVVNLAEALYEERTLPSGRLDNMRLAILADAMEEAGCASKEILAHCRQPGEHVRGCWAVDWALGKT
jgi:hypothetical protein